MKHDEFIGRVHVGMLNELPGQPYKRWVSAWQEQRPHLWPRSFLACLQRMHCLGMLELVSVSRFRSFSSVSVTAKAQM